MKMNKLLSGMILSGIVLSMNVVALGVTGEEANAATVVSETKYVKTMSFDHADLKAVTGVDLLTSTDVETVYAKLKDTASWTTLGYNNADAKLIASRFTKSYKQAIGILNDMTKNEAVGLKVVTTNKIYYKNANIGTISLKKDTTESSNNGSTSTESSNSSSTTESSNNESTTESSKNESNTTESSNTGSVISETKYVKTMSFNHADLKAVTGVDLLTSTDVETVYTKLKDASSWTTLGYSDADAKLIASRFSNSYYQAIGILNDMTKNEAVGLKVVTTNKPYYKNASIGTVSIKKDTTESSNNGSTGTESSNNGSTTESSNNNNTNTTTDTTLSAQVKEIEVEIEYRKDDIDLDYDVKSNGKIKAEVDNEVTNEKLKNADAQAYIETIFEGLDLKTASQDTIKNQIMTKLNAPDNFKKFQFKAKLKDGNKIEFKIK